MVALRDRGDDIEADLKRFYGVDLRDLWRPGGGDSQLTLRLLWVYIRRLPMDSALAISDNGGTMPWTLADHLLADNWLIHARVNAPKSKRPKDHPRREDRNKAIRARRASRKVGTYERAKARNKALLAKRSQNN